MRDTSINDLKANPAAWAIVQKALPGVEQRIASDALKPHLTNFSFESLLIFGVVDRQTLDHLDVQLQQLEPAR